MVWPAIISAGAGLLGSMFSSSATSSANAANIQASQQANALALADKEKDRALQREFAQSGIQWKVDDAKKAGIHPLYAVGGNFASYTPSAISLSTPNIQADTSLGSGVAAMGQDIGRAIHATRSGAAREDAFNTAVQSLTLTKMGLENDLLASQIAKLRANANPPLPAGGVVAVPKDSKWEERPRIAIGGTEIATDPGWVNAETVEKRYGDIAQNVYGVGVLAADAMNHYLPARPIAQDPVYQFGAQHYMGMREAKRRGFRWSTR